MKYMSSIIAVPYTMERHICGKKYKKYSVRLAVKKTIVTLGGYLKFLQIERIGSKLHRTIT